MRKSVGILVAILVATLSGVADKTPPKQHEHVMPCCYCACQLDDMKECHKLCELPDGEDGHKRAFTKTENKFCTELCAIKKEGCVHLNH